jgi:hypothetical protein
VLFENLNAVGYVDKDTHEGFGVSTSELRIPGEFNRQLAELVGRMRIHGNLLLDEVRKSLASK